MTALARYSRNPGVVVAWGSGNTDMDSPSRTRGRPGTDAGTENLRRFGWPMTEADERLIWLRGKVAPSRTSPNVGGSGVDRGLHGCCWKGRQGHVYREKVIIQTSGHFISLQASRLEIPPTVSPVQPGSPVQLTPKQHNEKNPVRMARSCCLIFVLGIFMSSSSDLHPAVHCKSS